MCHKMCIIAYDLSLHCNPLMQQFLDKLTNELVDILRQVWQGVKVFKPY